MEVINSINMILKPDVPFVYMLVFLTLGLVSFLGMAEFYSEECRACIY